MRLYLRTVRATAGDQHILPDDLGICRDRKAFVGISRMVSAEVRPDVLREFSRIASDILDAGNSGANWFCVGSGGADAIGIFARTALAGANAGLEFICFLHARLWLMAHERSSRRVPAVLLFQRHDGDALLHAMAQRESACREE